MENSKSEAIRVLLVEDNFAEARLIQETLKELQTADFRIIHVDRLQKALERLSQNEIDVILLDLSLPDAQGLETVERTLTAAPHLPVVVLTGLDDEIIAANAVRAGAQDYLVKGQADGNSLARAMRYAIARNSAEQALRESEERYRLLVDSNIIGIIIADTSGRISDSNDVFLNMLGYSREELTAGRIRWDSVTPPEWREVDERIMEQVLKRGASDPVEKEYFCKDGSRVPILLGVAAMEQLPDAVNCVCFVLDLTEQKRAAQEREEMSRRNQALVTALGQIVYDWRPATNEVVWDGDYTKVLGYSPKEMGTTTESWTGRVHPDDLESVLAEVENATRERCDYDFEYRFRHRDGSYRWMHDRGVLTVSPEGKLERIIGVFVDITERKRVAEDLQDSERRYRLLFQSNPHPMWVYDLDTFSFLAVNDAAVAHYGFSRDEFLSMTIKEIRPPEDIPRLVENVMRVTEGVDEAGIWRHRKRDGTIIDVEITSHTLILGGRKAELVLAHDVTERKVTEEALRESEQKFRALFEESKDVVFFTTPEGKLLDINIAGVELFGYSSREELLRVNVVPDLYFNPQDRLTYQQLMLQQGYVKDFEIPLRKKDGSKLIVLETSTAIRDKSGTVVAYRGIMRDVTHLKELQHQFLQSQKMEAIGQLAGGVAHDFNNTLMAISGYSELLMLKLKEDDPNRRIASEIERATAQSAGLTRQLLAFSRRQILSPKILDLNESISAMQNMVQRLIGEDIELQVSGDAYLGFIKADPGQIEQVILNLAVNARDAMPQGGRLLIQTSNVELDEQYVASHVGVTPGSYILLAISDTGTGMDEATLSRIFEPFFTTKPEGKGTGLGLSTVYGIVKQSDGHIWVYSQPRSGTTFKIYFPRVDEGGEMHASPPQSSQDVSGHGETVFLVDDNESVRTSLAALLTQKGYKVMHFDQGLKVLEMISHYDGPIDLLITDVIMPEMNGPELAERIRIVRPGLKVLFMSGYADEAISRHSELDANSAFLFKPAPMQAFLLKIRELLGRGTQTSET